MANTSPSLENIAKARLSIGQLATLGVVKLMTYFHSSGIAPFDTWYGLASVDVIGRNRMTADVPYGLD